MLKALSSVVVIFWLSLVCCSVAYANLFTEDDLAILDISYKRQLIGNGLDVYLTDDSYYIPLIDFIMAMELDIVADDSKAEGVQANGDKFILEFIEQGWRVVEGDNEAVIFSEGDGVVLKYDDLIYVDKNYITTWFGVAMQLDFSESLLSIDFIKRLPVQDRLERRNQKVSEQNYMERPQQPLWNQPYAFMEVPSLDVRASYSVTRNDDVRIKDFRNLIYSGRTIGDLLGMSTETFFTGNRDDGLVGGSIRMDRFDNSREMLGVLGLSQISIGDVNSPNTGLSGSAYGRGILIGNDMVSGGKSRDVRDIEGDFYPGWEVELYLNNTLVGYLIIDDTGHYKFSDLVLFEGVNEFTLKFYGPHGEREEQQRKIVVGDDPENEHPFRYSVSLSQPGKSILNIDDRDVGSNDDYRASFFGRFKVTDRMDFNFSLEEARIKPTEKEVEIPENTYDDIDVKRYYSAGMQMYFGGINLGVNGSIEERVRTTGGLSVSGTFYGTAIYGQLQNYSYADNYEANEGEDRIFKAYSLALNKRFNALSIVMNGAHEEYEFSNRDNLDLGLSTRFGWLNWNNTLNYINEKNIASQNNDVVNNKLVTGATFFSASYRLADFRLGGVYSVEPEAEFTNANISTAFRLTDRLNLDLSASHALFNDETFYRVGMNWITDSFRVTPSFTYNDRGRWQGFVQLSTSLGKRSGRLGNYYKAASNPAITRGAVRARLYEDKNADGVYQTGEPLLSGGELSAVQSRRKGRSNRAGIAWLELMPSWDRTDIVVNTNSINEGYMAMGREPFSVVPRPGRITELDIPFLRVGEIDGNVEIIDGENVFPGLGIYIELVDSNGVVADMVRSDSGSYFNFAQVPPGSYKLQVKDYVLIDVIPKTIVIDGTGNYEDGVRILVEQKEFKDETVLPLDDIPLSNSGLSDSTETASIITPPAFTGIDTPVVEQTVEASLPVMPIFDVPTVNKPAEVEVVDEPVVDEPVVAVVPKPELPSDNYVFWGVQAGSFSQEQSALKLVEKIRAEGFSAQIKQVDLPQGKFHRVFASGFIDEASAKDAKDSLDQAFGTKSIVKKM